MEFRAAVFEGPGNPLKVQTVSLPDEIGPDEVLVKLKASGVCHSDYHVFRGEWTAPGAVVLGHEGAGIVERTGDRVSSVQVGDHVALSWSPSCGRCSYCTSGRPALCQFANETAYQHLSADGRTRLRRGDEAIFSYTALGTFGEYALVGENAVIKIDPRVPFPQAALVGCAVATGVGAVVNTAQVRPGDTVLVVGCGGVGLNIVQGARLSGAGMIIAADISAEKLAEAIRFGATDVIDSGVLDLEQGVAALTRGVGVDHAFEAIGRPALIEAAYRSTRRGGQTIVVGQAPENSKVSIDPFEMSDQEKVLRGSNYGSTRARSDFPALLEHYLAGRIEIDSMVTRVLSIEDAAHFFDDIAASVGIRTVVVYD